jgi:trehalose-6-phosphatase
MPFAKVDNSAWQPNIKKVIQAYVDNIDGSFIEERKCGILYNYKNADNEHGTLFHYDIYKHIMKILNGTNTEVINSKGTLEIKSAGIKMVSDPFESSYVLFCVV